MPADTPAHPERLRLRVRALTWEAEGVLGIELTPLDEADELPPFEAGAHLDLHLGPVASAEPMVRSYSLTNTPGERHRYCLGVNLDAASRGGSRWLHERLRPGAVLSASAPRNQFHLDEAAPHSVFIAGGIGITPLLAMARRMTLLQRPWTLHQAARSRAHAAYVERLRELASVAGARVLHHWDDEAGRVLDVPGIVAALPEGAHVYACGPAPLLESFHTACARLEPARVHFEAFSAAAPKAKAGGFEVTLARSGKRVQVAPGQTILEAVEAAGVAAAYSCREGLCGTCEVKVLAGTPDHRDSVLSAAEQAEGKSMMICCSGSLTPTLELDL